MTLLQQLLTQKSVTVQNFSKLPAAGQFKLPHQPYNYLEEVRSAFKHHSIDSLHVYMFPVCLCSVSSVKAAALGRGVREHLEGQVRVLGCRGGGVHQPATSTQH